MPTLVSRIVEPRFPATAIGLEKGIAAVVHLERAGGKTCTIRRAATFSLSDSIVRPSFDEPNILAPQQLAEILKELATSAGLLRQKRWSLSLPADTARTLVFTLDSQAQSGSELQDILKWKMERGFGTSLDELSISREKLQKDPQGRDRYLAVGVNRAVLAEYEAVINSLNWRVGLVLPRQLGESRWLMRNGDEGDSLLVSSSDHGFTAVVLRHKHPLIVRTVNCNDDECEDEFYRLLLFYRDRNPAGANEVSSLSRMMVIGNSLSRDRAEMIVRETMGIDLTPLEAEDLGLTLPGRDLSFDVVAAPAGLATLSL